MTPQERQMIDELFDKLAKLEASPRDAEAASAIAQGLRRAPNAVYALTQTVLVQDEALRRANDRIEELEHRDAGDQRPAGGFLDTMRDALTGGSSRGSVPSVRSSRDDQPKWNTGQVLPQGGGQQNGPYAGAPPAGGAGFGGGGGSSFLGTAAAAATGMIGGSLLMNGIRGLMGGGHQQAFGDSNGMSGSGNSPWGGSNQSGDNLSREAGLNDIGKNNSNDRAGQSASDQAMLDADQDQDQDQDDDDDFDAGDMDSGDSDYA